MNQQKIGNNDNFSSCNGLFFSKNVFEQKAPQSGYIKRKTVDNFWKM